LIAKTDEIVETQYGTQKVKRILNQSTDFISWKIILSPWFIRARIQPTIRAILRALLITLFRRASFKKLSWFVMFFKSWAHSNNR